MIAAVSIACDAIFVTANKKHFEHIQDLKLDSWEIDSFTFDFIGRTENQCNTHSVGPIRLNSPMPSSLRQHVIPGYR